MKKQATIIRWDDARGFGFMRSPDTSADVFFHVKDWAGGSTRPVVGLGVAYEEINVGGKGPRGMAVRPAGQIGSSIRSSRRTATSSSHGADTNPGPMLLLIFAYAVLLGWCAASGRLQIAIVLSVFPLNVATFFAYWFDKAAARRGAWRTSEQTLHLLSLLGGWPGALRHKSRKASFRASYWGTVAVHWAVLGTWLFLRTVI